MSEARDVRVDCPSCTVTFRPKWNKKVRVTGEERIIHGRREKKIETELSASCPLCHHMVRVYER